MVFLKRQFPVLLAFIFGMALWLQYYVPSKASNKWLEDFSSSWLITLAGCALILGVFSAVFHHAEKVKQKRAGFGYSLITLVFFSITAFCGFVLPLIAKLSPGSGINPIPTEAGTPFDWIFNNIQVPLDSTVFALLAFFVASAAFRAFRARSMEATVLLISACLMMLGRVAWGQMIGTEHLNVAHIAEWILNNPSTGAQRGILFGVYLSQVALALRIIFGIERTYLGGG